MLTWHETVGPSGTAIEPGLREKAVRQRGARTHSAGFAERQRQPEDRKRRARIQARHPVRKFRDRLRHLARSNEKAGLSAGFCAPDRWREDRRCAPPRRERRSRIQRRFKHKVPLFSEPAARNIATCLAFMREVIEEQCHGRRNPEARSRRPDGDGALRGPWLDSSEAAFPLSSSALCASGTGGSSSALAITLI